MLPNASAIRALDNRSALDPSVLTGTLSAATFDRETLSDVVSNRFSCSHNLITANRFEPPTISQLELTFPIVSGETSTQVNARSRFLAPTESSTDPEWLRDLKATIARRSRAFETDAVPGNSGLIDVDRRDISTPLSVLPAVKSVLEAGRTLTAAYSFNITSSLQSLSGFVGSAATNAYYRFTFDTTSKLTVSLSDLTADADLQIIRDANGNGLIDVGEVLVGSYQPGVQPESIAIGLTAGIYFIHVYQYSGDTSYTLGATATPVSLPPGYDTSDGYGLVNAGTTVASAIGKSLAAAAPSAGSNAWELNLVNASTAWANGYTGQGVIVAVVDTGIDIMHPDLADNIWINPGEIAGNGLDDDKNGFVDDVNGWDFADRDNMPIDLNGHGTHVAGTIAAVQNGFGVTGVAYSAKLMPIRVLGANGGSNTDVAAGIRYAADNGARVINLSLGGSASSPIVDAVQYASQKGALVVMAAGNDGGSQPTFPANLANQWGLAVGAIDNGKKLAPFSARAGATPLNYVVAPGVNVISTTPNNTYQSKSGTSMATPHVAGVAALVLSANPNLTPAQLTSLLTANASLQGLTV